LLESAAKPNGPTVRGIPASPSDPPVTEVHLKEMA
jgi:hypothetical protein